MPKITITGLDSLQKALKEKIKMQDVQRVVWHNGSQLQRQRRRRLNMQPTRQRPMHRRRSPLPIPQRQRPMRPNPKRKPPSRQRTLPRKKWMRLRYG